jgi:predicted DNA binding CopG/RHH family protein
MANPKKAKINEALGRVPKNKLGSIDVLSTNLAKKIGNLDNKYKITIRLDVRVLDAVKMEADELGVGYQRLINNKLRDLYPINDSRYSKVNTQMEIKDLTRKIQEIEKRLNKFEKEKKRA